MHHHDITKSFSKSMTLAITLGAALLCAGCQSPMYSGMPEEDFSRSAAPAYAPGTYEPPYQVGRHGRGPAGPGRSGAKIPVSRRTRSGDGPRENPDVSSRSLAPPHAH